MRNYFVEQHILNPPKVSLGGGGGEEGDVIVNIVVSFGSFHILCSHDPPRNETWHMDSPIWDIIYVAR